MVNFEVLSVFSTFTKMKFVSEAENNNFEYTQTPRMIDRVGRENNEKDVFYLHAKVYGKKANNAHKQNLFM